MNNIHDSQILNYQINFEYSKIEIVVLNEQGEHVNISFNDIFAFHFEDQLPSSIILDIVEAEIDLFATENKELLDKRKN